MKHTGKTITLFTLCLLALGTQISYTASVTEEDEKEQIDDWEYSFEDTKADVMAQQFIQTKTFSAPRSQMNMIRTKSLSKRAAPMAESIGFSVGGAKDADNFFQNLKQGYLPRYSSLTYEGLFYDYTFDTGQEQECKDLFCPSYARGVNKDVFSGKTDYYLSLGLNSGLTEASFQRKNLNLVVVLDISGSMSSPFNSYHYDTNAPNTSSREERTQSKMELANQSIVAMLSHLHKGDHFSMVLFNNNGYRAKPSRLIEKTDMEAISKHILAIQPHGGTNMSSGLQLGIEQFNGTHSRLSDPNIYENRIIFLTDAMPNQGELSKGGLFDMVHDAAGKNIFTSFIGIGVDFNPDLVEHITKTRGANYYAVHSSEDFKKRLNEEFDFMVTPLVFNLELRLSSNDYEIAGVYGSPEADLATGQMMKINTLFPSSTEEEEVRGGVVLVKLRKTGTYNGPVHLQVSYEDRDGKRYTSSDSVQFSSNTHHWDNKGIQKAALLSEYVSLLKNWLLDSRKGCNDQVISPFPCFPYGTKGLIHPDFRPERRELQTWEQRSCPLEISEGYQKLFSVFSNHFAAEMAQLNDPTLQKEMNILKSFTKKHSTGKVDDWQVQ